jgi:gas vesicle protein
MKRLAAASNAARLTELGQGIETLRTAKIASADQLASMLEPLAQAMAALTDETRETMAAIAQQGREQGDRLRMQIDAASSAWSKASSEAQQVVQNLETAARQTERRQYALVVTTGLMTALLVSAFWLWLAPPTVENHLDAKAVADMLRPEIAPAKPSKGR